MVKTKSSDIQLTVRDKSVLIAIKEKPLATYDELAEMTELPKSVVFGIVKKLVDPALPAPYFLVVGLPHLGNLGLETIDVIVKANSHKKLQILKELCGEHPYTMFRSLLFGDANGMLIQLKIPDNSLDLVEKFFRELKNRRIIEDFKILQFSYQYYSEIKVNAWNYETLSWNFNWKEWFENNTSISKMGSKPLKKKPFIFKKPKSCLKQLDIAILGELGLNARRKKIDMIKSLKKHEWDITAPTFSRRLKTIQDEYIETYRVFINPRSFDILNPLLIWGYGDKTHIQKIKNLMEGSPIPFTSVLKTNGTLIYWYLHLPTSLVSDLLNILRPILSEIHYNYVDYPRTHIYLPNTEAWDDKIKNWRVNEEYCVSSVLEKLK